MKDKKEQGLNIDVLKVIHSVNDTNILFRDTNVIVGNKSKNGILNYKGEALFEQSFAIMDLTKFIDAIQIFEKSELSFANDHVLIKDGASRKTMRYSFAGKVIMDKLAEELLNDKESPKLILNSARKGIKSGSFFKFKFSSDLINEIVRIGNKFGFRELVIRHNPKTNKIVLEVMNIAMKGDKYTLESLSYKDSNSEIQFAESILIGNLLGNIDFTCYCFDDKPFMYMVSEDDNYEYIIGYNGGASKSEISENDTEDEKEDDDKEDEKPVAKKKFKIRKR
jgi:hypothetical protein